MSSSVHTRGLTLLEVIVAATLLVGVVGLALATYGQSHAAVTESMLLTELELKASHLEQRMRREIGNSRNVVATDLHTVTFEPITGVDANGAIQIGAARTIRFVHVDDDDANDDDNDGLVDDGRVELVIDGNAITLADNVAESFAIVQTTDTRRITVSFTLGGRVSVDGAHQVAREFVIALKNVNQ